MTTYRDINAAGDVTRWLRDEATGLVTNKVYADGKGPRYTYTPDGRLATRIWARGIVTTYSYDDNGSLTNTVYSDGTPTISLAYNRAGRQIEAHDAAGVTTCLYDEFGSLTNETVRGDDALVVVTNTIERFYDTFGRNAGYALNGVRQSMLAYDPATGRLALMQIPSIEESNHLSPTPTLNSNSFQWTYLAGSDIKSSLAYPNGLTASWTYGNRGELLEVRNARTVSSSPSMTSNDFEIISQYDYTYDAAGRRVACAKSGSAFTSPDTNSYLYNTRSELTNATAAVDSAYRYTYDFDDIGNRKTSAERGVQSAEYMSNELNQYTNIEYSAVSPATCHLSPTYDADGNQTLINTATGIWSVTYNGENRPVCWELVSPNSNTQTLLLMSYDRMGRRVTKNNQHFVYNDYLQITDNIGNTYIWDCTENVATRPLAWSTRTTNHESPITNFYTHDGNKNVSEVVAADGSLSAHYEYAPFGAVILQRGESAATNPFRFSSEYAEDDTATVYYNYRHYEPVMGRWLSRDFEVSSIEDLYVFVGNASQGVFDRIGLKEVSITFVSDQEGFDWAEFWADVLNISEDLDSPDDFDPNSYLGECDCFASMLVIMHGADDGLGTTNATNVTWGDALLIEDKQMAQISDMFKGIRFCKKCTLELRSCYQGRNELLLARLKANTGCDVKLYRNKVSILGEEEKRK